MAAPRSHASHAVYTAAKWGDAWTLQEHLYCDGFSFAAAPDVAEATLSYNYGRIQRADSGSITTEPKLVLNGLYVKIVLEQDETSGNLDGTPKRWVGVIVETQDQRHGKLTVGQTQVDSGKQIFQCRGLEFLLQRKIVNSSFVQDSEGAEREIGRAIGFNLGQGRDSDHRRQGNKGTVGLNDAPVFAPNLDDATEWTAYDIVTYLLYYHPPGDIDGNDQLEWTIDDAESAKILEALKPTIAAEGKTVKQLFDEAIDRRRLLGWTVTYDTEGDDEESDNGAPRIHVFTFNGTDLTLPSGDLIPANTDTATWTIDDEREINSAVVAEDDATRFHVVVARGEALTGTFTMGALLETFDASYSMAKDWDSTSQTAYNAGGSGATGYSGWDATKKAASHFIARAEPRLHKVYRYYRLQPEPHFDGKIDGEITCPDPTSSEENPTQSPFWWPGLRFLDKLPLLTDHDYAVVDDVDTTDRTIDNSFPEYVRPFAVISDGTFYHHLERMGQVRSLSETAMENNGIGFSASLRMQDHIPGIIIDVSPQHYLAVDEFAAADATDDWPAEYDWKDIKVTVCCEFDQHVEAKWPEEELTTDADVVRKLEIDVPNCRLDYLVPGTVIGLNDEGTVMTTDGGYVRDDRTLLKDIARSAFAWYGETRKAITVVQQNLNCDRFIGELITQIGATGDLEDINSVITKLTFDLLAGTVTVQTQYAELDPRVGVA